MDKIDFKKFLEEEIQFNGLTDDELKAVEAEHAKVNRNTAWSESQGTIPPRYMSVPRLSKVTADIFQAEAYKVLTDLSKKEKFKGIILIGPVGCGKTFMSVAFLKQYLHNFQMPFTFVSVYQLIDAKDKRQNHDYKGIILLDDLGAERTTDYAREAIDEFIYMLHKNKRRVVLTTNNDMREINKRYERSASRIREMTDHKIEFPGNSRDLRLGGV